MPEDTAETQATTAAAAADAQGGGQDATDAGTGTAAAPLTREQDAIAAKARRDEADKRKAAEAKLAEAEAQLAEYRKAEEARKQAEMSELEKAQAAAAAAEERAAAAEERAAAAEAARQAAEANTLRANLIAIEAADLPAAYRAQVAGATEEDVKASIAAVRDAYLTDRDALLAGVAQMSPEQLVERYGETIGKQLAERLPGKPSSIGAAPAVGKPVPPPGEEPEYDPNGGLGKYLSFLQKKKE